MAITLQTLITEAADYIKADVDDDDFSIVEARLISALNEAKNIIAQRTRLTTSENITLDDNSCFDVADLTKTFWGLVGVTVDGGKISTQEQNGLIWCGASPLETVTVEYEYIPADMVATTDAYPLPAYVSYRLLCYFAAARYYEIKGTATSLNKYRFWQNEFENGVNSLRGGGKMARRRIKVTYVIGDC